jgi:hypothetical protein
MLGTLMTATGTLPRRSRPRETSAPLAHPALAAYVAEWRARAAEADGMAASRRD